MDHSSRPEFYEYYAERSLGGQTLARYAAIQRTVLFGLKSCGARTEFLDVADIGCGAGTQSIMWARLGHNVYGLDVNQPLVELARERASQERVAVRFEVGSADSLPLQNESVDVCLVPELLEHVSNWQECVCEFRRILRPGGALFVSTTNRLCPRQEEFNLPLYSWYPGPVKRYFERLASTTRPQLANHATYPAVNWFTSRGLARYLDSLGFDSMDRFDLMNLESKGKAVRAAVALIQRLSLLRWMAHVATPYTVLVSIKRADVAKDLGAPGALTRNPGSGENRDQGHLDPQPGCREPR